LPNHVRATNEMNAPRLRARRFTARSSLKDPDPELEFRFVGDRRRDLGRRDPSKHLWVLARESVEDRQGCCPAKGSSFGEMRSCSGCGEQHPLGVFAGDQPAGGAAPEPGPDACLATSSTGHGVVCCYARIQRPVPASPDLNAQRSVFGRRRKPSEGPLRTSQRRVESSRFHPVCAKIDNSSREQLPNHRCDRLVVPSA
jgi:hypothetical protein